MTIVESSEEEVAKQSLEAESRKHDAKDLDAQIRAANAAEKQILPAWMGAILSAIGTGLLVWTLLETRKASAAAADAAASAKQALHADRAWLIGKPKFNEVNFDGDDYGLLVSTQWTNQGKSPAVHAVASTGNSEFLTDERFEEIKANGGDSLIGPSDFIHTTPVVINLKEMTKSREPYLIKSIIEYNSIFDEVVHRSELVFSIAYVGTFDPFEDLSKLSPANFSVLMIKMIGT